MSIDLPVQYIYMGNDVARKYAEVVLRILIAEGTLSAVLRKCLAAIT